jgi:hypothetical protein
MSSYVKATNFATKDTLTTGDPAKIIKGTEIDTEFNSIASAISSKADVNNPTFTGTPAAPTASPGTTTTQLATTAFAAAAATAALQGVYPVGSIYMNATNSTNPATLLGFGTWSAFGAGRVPVGFNASDPLFDSAEETGGSKDAIVVSHTHTGTTNTNGDHTHTYNRDSSSNWAGGGNIGLIHDLGATATTSTAGSHNHTFTTASTGSSGTNANLPPYITVYMWKRVA